MAVAGRMYDSASQNLAIRLTAVNRKMREPRFSKDDHATARGNYSPEHWGILTERGNYSSKINNRLGDWCRLKDAICQGFNAGSTEYHEYKNYEGGGVPAAGRRNDVQPHRLVAGPVGGGAARAAPRAGGSRRDRPARRRQAPFRAATRTCAGRPPA
jgi:hypothetical protein